MMKFGILTALCLAAPALAAQPQQAQPQPASAAQPAADPVGGYQPATPALQGTPQPGSPIVFQPSQSPSQAFPPPPPLDHYPICKRGQTDKCMEPHHR